MHESLKSAFLLLPREIRDQIYVYVLVSSIRTPPPTLDQAGERSSYSRDRYCPSHIAYELDKLPDIVPSLGLLRCCYQTRSELQELIIREDTNERKQPIYRLDCILTRFKAFPTWVALPTSLEHVHRLEITVRVFYMLLQDDNRHGKLLILFPGIFDLLYRLFNHGPHFYMSHGPAFPVCVDTLTLYLIDAFPRPALPHPQESSSVDPLPITKREVSFERVWQCISGLAQYGLLRGRVNTIRICFGSEIKVVQVNTSTVKSRATFASRGEWLSWKYRWHRDPCALELDI